jgi:flagellar motor switch protein FliM
MSDTVHADDPAIEWEVASPPVDQTHIESLAGDPGWQAVRANDRRQADAPADRRQLGEPVGRKRGFEALVGGALVGVGRMPTLNIVVDRLAQLMTASMRSFMADNADVTIDRIRAVRLGEFLDTVTQPTMIALLHVEEWDGYCLAALDSRLIASVIEVLLGGGRNQLTGLEGRACTAIERTFIERLINEVVARDLGRAFDLVCDANFTLERCESNASYAAITKLSAAAVTFRAEIAMEGRGGNIDFLIPYATLDPVHALLAQETVGKRRGGDPAWRAHLHGILPLATMKLRAVVERRQISATEVLGWQPGAKLLLDRRHDEPIDVVCDGLPVLRARIAEKGGRMALHVEDRLIADDWPAGAGERG